MIANLDTMEKLLARLTSIQFAFDPHQPRDESGKWITIELQGDEFGKHLTEAETREAAKRFAKQNLQGKKFLNFHTKKEISVSGGGIRKAMANTGDIRRAKLFAVLPQMLRYARHVRTDSPRDRDPNIKAYHRFGVTIKHKGRLEPVKFVVQEDNNGHWFYNHDFGRAQ